MKKLMMMKIEGRGKSATECKQESRHSSVEGRGRVECVKISAHATSEQMVLAKEPAGLRINPENEWRLMSNHFRSKELGNSNSTNKGGAMRGPLAVATVEAVIEGLIKASIKRVENKRKRVKRRINYRFFKSWLNGTFSINTFQKINF